MTETESVDTLGIADELQRLAVFFRERNQPRDERLELFMSGVIEAIRHLETTTAGALRLQEAPRDTRLGYTLREVSELAPAPYGRCLKAAQNYALVAHHEGTNGRWVVSREAVIAWISEGCPQYLRHPGGVAPGSPIYREWIRKRRLL